ncbi:glutamyl aminopeptidase [Patella vulgata]|uniref:glutamyl aminopeptidase n=1 Tax=Patella vulgata TaxID=6465 RepID=UPI00217FB3D4|nr:glutamyl aminopeptidase [Patella vulgata]
MVTMKWWDDLWLNEGFASILMYFGMNAIYPEWNVFATQVVEDMFPVMDKDALSTSHPVSTEVKDPNDIPQFFDIISYNKGMAILRMMGSFIGLDNFRMGLQMYVKRYKFKNAARDQLWQTFTEAVNNTFVIKPIMDTWTRQMGYPVVNVLLTEGVFTLQQKRFLISDEGTENDDNPLGYKWYIPFTYVTENNPTHKKTAWLNLGSNTIPKADGWLLGNYDYTGFYRVNYETEMWKKLAEQLVTKHTVFLETNRAGLIADAFALARANLLDYSIALNMTVYLKSEQSYIPWRAFLDSIKFLRGMIANTSAYGKLQKYLSNLVDPVFERVGASDTGNLPKRYLRQIIMTMACEVGVEKTVIYAKSMFNAWKKFSTKLPTDFAMIIYSVGVREGGVEEWDFVWTRSQNTNVASERAMMMEALAQTQKPWLLWRYINWVFDPEKINLQDVRLVFSYYVKNPLSRMVALEFLMSRWNDLNRRFANDMPEIITEVTPFVNSEYTLKQLETLIAEQPPKSASKAAANTLALIRANIKWMKNNYAKTTEWLDNRVNLSRADNQ